MPAVVAGEGHGAHRVALAQGHVGQQQAGVEGMVEVRQVAVLAAHAAAAVEQEEDLLVAFVLVFAGDRRAFASGGLPVDLAQGVAVAEFAQLVELQAEAAALAAAYADLVEPVVDRHQFGAVEAGEVRVDAGLAACFQVAALPPQAQRAGQFQLAAGKHEVTAVERPHPVADLGAFARAQFDLLRQVLKSMPAGR